MAHESPDFETKDVLGKTEQFTGSVGTSSALVPAVAGKKISKAFVKNANSNSFNKGLKVAFDGQANYVLLQKGEFMTWEPKNNNSNSPITQIRIEGTESGVNYEIIMDFEP